MKKVFDFFTLDVFLTTIGFIADISGIISGYIPLVIVSSIVLLIGLIVLARKMFIKHNKGDRKDRKITPEWHLGLSSTQKSLSSIQHRNRNIHLKKYIKNVVYSDDNRTSNVTYIFQGLTTTAIKSIVLPVGAASAAATNLINIGFCVKTNRNDFVEDNYNFYLDHNYGISLEYSQEIQITHITPFSVECLLPFEEAFESGEAFQVVFYYTWRNSIVEDTDSTSFLPISTFPNGVDKLIANLVFTKKPYRVELFKVVGRSKDRYQSIRDIKTYDNKYIIHWETESVKSDFLIQRTIDFSAALTV